MDIADKRDSQKLTIQGDNENEHLQEMLKDNKEEINIARVDTEPEQIGEEKTERVTKIEIPQYSISKEKRVSARASSYRVPDSTPTVGQVGLGDKTPEE